MFQNGQDQEIRGIGALQGKYGCDQNGDIWYLGKFSYHGRPVPRLVKKRVNPDGYHKFHAFDPTKGKTCAFSVHRQVALTWLGSPPQGMQVNHKNGIKTDNRIENLEWVTLTENNRHACGFLKVRTGENHYNAKITEDIVRFIRSSDETLTSLAKKFGLGTSQVWRIKMRETWAHVK